MKKLKDFLLSAMQCASAWSVILFFGGYFLCVTSARADTQPRSASLSYSQKALTGASNPAAASLVLNNKKPHVMTGGSLRFSGGIEYGDLDELFAKIDDLALLFNPPEDELPPSGEAPPPSPENPDANYIWEDLFYTYPELEDRLKLIEDKVITTVGVLALIKAEGYGKAEASGEINFVLDDDLFGGVLLLSGSVEANSKALGIFDEINFDRDIAKEQLSTITDFVETDPIQALDLSGGITLYYDPKSNKVKMSMVNDSLLLIKAAKESTVSFLYSRKAFEVEKGSLYWGIKPSLYRIGLTNASTRIGNVTDTEALFEDIKSAQFVYKNGYDVDFGVIWASQYYQFGLSIKNIFEHDYHFPELDKAELTSNNILVQLTQHETYTLERQVKLEAGIYSKQRTWSLNAELDVNSIKDPMRDNYQWLTLTTGYTTDNWWLPNARVGFSHNLAGTKLSYINAGVTVLKMVNIDVATTVDTITLDGVDRKRGFNVNLGIQFEY